MARAQTLTEEFTALKGAFSEFIIDSYADENDERAIVVRGLSAGERLSFGQATLAFVERLIGSLIFSYQNTNHHLGTGTDPFFANLLTGCRRKADYSIDAPTMIGFDSKNRLQLSIHPLRYIGLSENVAMARDLLRHECFHLLFEHLTLYQDVFRTPKKRDWMSMATDAQINQNLNNMPQGSIQLADVEEAVGHPLDPFQGSLYYYEALAAADAEHDTDEKGPEKSQFEQEGVGAGPGSGVGSEASNAASGGRGRHEGQFSEDFAERTKTEYKNDPGAVMTIAPSDMQSESRHDGFKGDSDELNVKKHAVEQSVERALKQLSDRQRGELGGQIELAISALHKKPLLDWRQFIKRGVGHLPLGYRRTKKRMNRRQPERFDVSGRQVDRGVTLLAFVDTSASMREEDLAYILGELENISRALESEVKVIQIDNVVQRVDSLNHVEMDDVMYRGRGGTFFQPAFEWLRQNGYNNFNSVSIYFTDGYGEPEADLDRLGYRNMYWVLLGDSLDVLSVDGRGKAFLLMDDPKYVAEGLAEVNDKWKGGI